MCLSTLYNFKVVKRLELLELLELYIKAIYLRTMLVLLFED